MRAAKLLPWAVVAVLAGGCGGDAVQEVRAPGSDEARELEAAERELEASLGLPEGGLAREEDAPAPPPSPPGSIPGPAPPGQAPEAPMRSGGDGEPANGCATSCRALGSMQRASARLCMLATEADPRCLDARTRLERARRLVRRHCPSCGA